MASRSDRTRLTVNFSGKVADALRELAQADDTTVTETLHRAVSLYSTMTQSDGSSAVSRAGFSSAEEVSFTSRQAVAGLSSRADALAALLAESSPTAAQDAPTRSGALELGLLGPDGQPLGPKNPARRALLIHVRTVSDALVREVAQEPTRMHSLTGTEFEEFVANLLFDQGFSVTRVPPGPDGGVDIYAASESRLGRFLYLVQCKRLQPTRSVGIGVVQRLYGRVEHDHATGGVVITSSQFSRDAREFAEGVSLRMNLHGQSNLWAWVEEWVGRRPGGS